MSVKTEWFVKAHYELFLEKSTARRPLKNPGMGHKDPVAVLEVHCSERVWLRDDWLDDCRSELSPISLYPAEVD